jgi:hypothetical protein
MLMPLDRLWGALHSDMVLNENIFENLSAMQSEVANLRQTYSRINRQSKGPNFGDEKVREAYVLAYHPGHARTYLDIFLNQGLGDHLIEGINAQSSIGVLGAGAGAESLAFLNFAAIRGFRTDGLSIGFVDKAEWSFQREACCFGNVRELVGTLPNKVDSFIQDLIQPEALSLLSEFIPKNDLIFCPAIYTELDAQNNGLGLISEVCRLMKVQSRILVIDQSNVNGFAEKCRRLANISQMHPIHQGDATVVVPAPPAGSLASAVLDGIPYQLQNGRIPRRKYDFSWALLQKV